MKTLLPLIRSNQRRFLTKALPLLVGSLLATAAQAAPGDQKWSLQIGPASSPGLAPNGDIIVAQLDKLRAISQTGDVKWSSPISAGYGPGICIAQDGVIYVGGDMLYAFNLDGSKRWEFNHNEVAFFTPVIAADGTIYSLAYNGPLYAVKPDGTLLWTVAAPRSSSELALAKDGTLVGGFSVINPDGINRWTAPNGGTLYSGPALDAQGGVYIGSQNASYVATLYTFESEGTPRWQFVADGTIISEPAVGDDGTIYFRTDAGKVFAVDATGQKRWEFDTGVPQLGSTPPAVAVAANGTVYVAAFDGILHALSATGEPKWTFTTGSGMAVAPLIGPDGTLYFGTGAGTFYAIEGEGSGLAQQAPWPMHRRDQRFSASFAEAPTLPATPQNISASINDFTDRVNVTWASAPGATSYEVWRSAVEDGGGATLLGPVFGKVQFQDRSSVEGQTNFYFVRSVNSAGSSALGGPAQGVRRVANEGELAWQFSISGALGTPAIAADGTAYSTGSDGKLYAIQANGVKKWEFDYFGSAATAPSVGLDGTIFFAASTRTNALTAPKEGWSFFAVTPAGEKKWQLDRRAVAAPAFAVGSDGSLFAATVEDTGYWLALNPDGSKKWEFTHEDEITSNVALGADGTLYAGTKDGQMLAVSKEGRFRWRLRTGGAWLGAIAIDGGGLLYASGNDLFAVNPDGNNRWSFPKTDSGVSPAAIGSDGTIYVGSNDGNLSVVNPSGTKITAFTVGGMPGASAVGADGAVYFASLSNPFAPQFTMYGYTANGTRKWAFTLGTGIGFPVMGPSNVVLFAANDGALYALRTGAPVGDTAWPEFQSDGERSSRARKVPTAPTAPQNVGANSSLSAAYVQISWSSVFSATGYDILRSTGTDAASAEVLATDVTGRLTYNDATGQPETLYNYWVRARNAGGASEPSGITSATRRTAVPGDLLYEWTLDGPIHGSPAIGDDGTIYVGVANPSTASALYALNRDGTIKWARAKTGWIYGSPAIGADGTIYYGAYAQNFVAVNPDGSLKWELNPGAGVLSSPAIGDGGEIYFGTAGGKFYSVNADGTIRWSFTAAAGIQSSPGIGGDGAIYFRAGAFLYSLSPDGTDRWHKSVFGNSQSSVYSTPAIGTDGTIYVGNDAGGFLALNPDGVERWRAGASSGFFASAAFDAAGNILIGSPGLLSLKPDGTTNWNFAAGPVWSTASIAANGLSYVPTYDGNLFAVNADGTMAWQTNVGATIISSPAVAPDGTIYVGGQDGKVRSYFGDSSLATSSWPMFQRDLKHSGRAEKRLVAAAQPTGVIASDDGFNNKIQVKWNAASDAWYYQLWRGTTMNAQDATLVADKITVSNSYDDISAEPGVTYYYWVRAGNDLGKSEFAGPDSGTRRFPVAGEKVGEIAQVFDAGSAPVEGKDGVIYVAGRGRLTAINTNWTKKWQFPSNTITGPYLFSPPTIAEDGIIYFGAPDGRVYAVGADGLKRWDYNAKSPLMGAPALGADQTIYICTGSDRKLLTLRPDGTTNWSYLIGGGPAAGASIDVNGTIYVGGGDRYLNAIQNDGTLKWKFNLVGVPNTAATIAPDGTVYVGATSRRLRAISADGADLWTFLAGGELTGPPVIGPDGTIYVGAGDSKIYAVSPGGQKKWDFLTGGAISGSPTIGMNGTVFLGSADRKVYAVDPLGKKIWDLNPRQPVTGLPIAGWQLLTTQDAYLAGTGDGTLHAVYAGAPLANAFWPMLGQNARHTGRAPNYLNAGADSVLTRTAGQDAQVQPQLSISRDFSRVELYEGTNLVAVSESAPFTLVWTNIPAGKHSVTLRAADTNGYKYVSAPFVIDAVAGSETITLNVTLDASGIALEFPADIGGHYSVLYSSDLQNWKTNTGTLDSSSGTIHWIDQGPPDTESKPSDTPLRFYRVIRQP